ncbi:hypothetical protein GCM10027176_02200 [Actinoallomurus bryophytorum]|uniref:Uncharacterized protein n=1 Tax=Actinoallomurus bryophytorum TaxID=1490222 RepID=A0A543CK90_9ACTN|nr:hypothetical protein [Actinoallomurus bryophytorum]TQL97499.1 hypothetical protein FB559_3090 [Actinoallomurus bryophytorum]
MTTFEDATELGFAVKGFLARPPIDALLDPSLPEDVLKQRLEMSLHHLEKLDAVTEPEATAIRDYIRHGKLPAPPSGPALLTVGSTLITVVLFLHAVGPGSLFGGMLQGLDHVVDATLDGRLHGGNDAAVTCAAIATTQVLQGLKSVVVEVDTFAVTGLKSGLKSALGLKS